VGSGLAQEHLPTLGRGGAGKTVIPRAGDGNYLALATAKLVITPRTREATASWVVAERRSKVGWQLQATVRDQHLAPAGFRCFVTRCRGSLPGVCFR